MRDASPFKNPASEAAVLAWHARALGSLTVPHEQRELPTSFGRTHLVAAGACDGVPLILVHGLGSNAALLAGELAHFAELGYRVYAPEVPGHPGRSEPRALPLAGDSHGRWLAEVMRQLGLARARLIGYSLGGFVVLKLGAFAPDRIERAVLAMPAGLSRPSVVRALPLIAQRLMYLATANAKWRQRMVSGMFAPGTTPDPLLFDGLDLLLEHARVDPRPIPVLAPAELASLRAPLLVLAGEHDPFFACAATLAGAARIVPGARAEVLAGTGHVFDREHLADFHARAHHFLA